jgi:hypothetical protein
MYVGCIGGVTTAEGPALALVSKKGMPNSSASAWPLAVVWRHKLNLKGTFESGHHISITS